MHRLFARMGAHLVDFNRDRTEKIDQFVIVEMVGSLMKTLLKPFKDLNIRQLSTKTPFNLVEDSIQLFPSTVGLLRKGAHVIRVFRFVHIVTLMKQTIFAKI